MVVRHRRTWAWGAKAAFGAAALFALALLLRPLLGLGGEAADVLLLLLAAGLAGAAAVWAAASVCSHYRPALRDLSDQVATLRSNPLPHALTGALQNLHLQDEWEPLFGHLEGLCASYRQALLDRVAQHESLESLRTLLSRADTDHRGLSLTVVQRG